MSTSHDGEDDLVQRVLEGEATAAEQHTLDALIAADPAARARFEAQADLLRRLSGARLAEVPADLHDAVMAEVRRSAVPGESTVVDRGSRVVAAGARPGFDRRWAFPAAALAVALVLLWFTAVPKPTDAPGSPEVSGTMAGTNEAGKLKLGEGAAALQVHWERARTGFVLRLDAGAEPLEIDLMALTAGSALRVESLAGMLPSSRGFNLRLPAHQNETYRGSASSPTTTIRIQVKFADGHTVVREIKITGLQAAAPEPNDPSLPTSAPPPGH